VENGWTVVGGKKPRRKGFVHRLHHTTTSYFFTNFPDDVTVNDLWTVFGRFGRVGEVHIPKNFNQQGRRFGFVKFREVADARELLGWMDDIWFGSFKLRVNISRFGKGEPSKKMKEVEVQETCKVGVTTNEAGKTFIDALTMKKKKLPTEGQPCMGVVQG
jgi:RNA recognition motif-containing protein